MTQDSTPPARSRWLIANLVTQLAFGLVVMTICLPSMQDWPAVFGASQASVQLTFSAYVAAYGGLQLVYGPLSDRLGRKPVLMAGLVLVLAGSVLGAVAPDLPMLVVARVLQGAGSAATMVVGRALVQDLFGPGERTRVMAFIGMTLGLCPPVGTLLGGHLHVRWGWQSNFVLMAVFAVGLLVTAWRGLPAGRPPARAAHAGAWRQFVSGYAQLAHERSFLAYVGILAMTTATFYTFLAGVPMVLADFGVTPDLIGWYILCVPLAYIVGNVLTTRMISRWGDRTLMSLGQVFVIGGLAAAVVAGLVGPHSPWALAIPLMVVGVGHGLLVPSTLAGTVGVVPALAGSAAALAGLGQQIAGAISGYVVGLVPHEGSANLALLMLGWALCGVAAQAVLHGRRRPITASG